MRLRTLLLAVLLLATVLPPASAQGAGPTKIDLTFTLEPQEGTVRVDLHVKDPGALVVLKLSLGQLESLQGEPDLGPGWRQEGGQAVVDLRDHPDARASWTANGRIEVVSHNGDGFTTHVSEAFAVVKAGDMMPTVGWQSPVGSDPTFETSMNVQAPDGWTVAAPWASTGDASYLLDGLIPRGFMAAGPDIEEVRLGEAGQPYRIVRVAGATEADDTEQILLAARGFLGGIYGEGAMQRFIVVAPDPMFEGGLGSPDGVFVHEDADARVVAHEMVHAFQRFRISRAPGEASIWFVEGTAVMHGVLLEVVAGVTSREDADTFLEERKNEAVREYAVDLTTAVYGSGNERAAYTKGPTVIASIAETIRNQSDGQHTITDVLRHLNDQAGGQAGDPGRITTGDLLPVLAEVTKLNFTDYFEAFVYGSDVPKRGAAFPGEASVRLLDTVPDPPVAGQAFEVRASLSNLDTRRLPVDEPVLVDGQEYGRLRATLGPGATAEATASVTALPRGNYSLQIASSTMRIQVLSPAKPHANVTVWPPTPSADGPLTLGVVVTNSGEAPFRGPVSILLDGRALGASEVEVAAGAERTVSVTVDQITPGEHRVQAQGPDGAVLASARIDVDQRRPSPAPGPGIVPLLTILAGAAALVQARRHRR